MSPLHATVTPDSAIAFTLTMDTNSLSQSLDSVNTAVSVAGEEEVSVVAIPDKSFPCEKVSLDESCVNPCPFSRVMWSLKTMMVSWWSS